MLNDLPCCGSRSQAALPDEEIAAIDVDILLEIRPCHPHHSVYPQRAKLNAGSDDVSISPLGEIGIVGIHRSEIDRFDRRIRTYLFLSVREYQRIVGFESGIEFKSIDYLQRADVVRIVPIGWWEAAAAK